MLFYLRRLLITFVIYFHLIVNIIFSLLKTHPTSSEHEEILLTKKQITKLNQSKKWKNSIFIPNINKYYTVKHKNINNNSILMLLNSKNINIFKLYPTIFEDITGIKYIALPINMNIKSYEIKKLYHLL